MTSDVPGPLSPEFLDFAEAMAERLASGLAVREPERLRASYLILELVAEVRRLAALTLPAPPPNATDHDSCP